MALAIYNLQISQLNFRSGPRLRRSSGSFYYPAPPVKYFVSDSDYPFVDSSVIGNQRVNATLINIPEPTVVATGPTAPRPLGETVKQERGRLLAFIRRRLPDPDEAEDVLQDVFVELTEAYRLAKPIERVAAWLFAVARNKISDWYRKSRPDASRTISLDSAADDDDDTPVLGQWLAAADDSGPESVFFRETLMNALSDALAELPDEQREVFVQHELEGRSFKDMAAEWHVSVNTLLSRKRYAVLHLRERLRDLYDDFLDEN